MGKILVIQPHRMLRQALVCALFPEHEVRTLEAIPVNGLGEEFDAVIVDADAVEKDGAVSVQRLRVIEGWNEATIWIRDPLSEMVPKRNKLFLLERPVTKDMLQAVLTRCLTAGHGESDVANKSAGWRSEQSEVGPERSQEQREVIELVDVVEEEPRRSGNRLGRTKT